MCFGVYLHTFEMANQDIWLGYDISRQVVTKVVAGLT